MQNWSTWSIAKESWKDSENKIYDLVENKLEMDIENVVLKRAHRTGKNKKNKKQEKQE